MRKGIIFHKEETFLEYTDLTYVSAGESFVETLKGIFTIQFDTIINFESPNDLISYDCSSYYDAISPLLPSYSWGRRTVMDNPSFRRTANAQLV